MLAAIKAEFRKLISVRSTYFVIGFALVLELLFVFWGNGYKAPAAALQLPDFLMSQIIDTVSALSLIGALIAVLQTTHEYRYNTITYTITSAKSRTKLLLSKIIVLTLFSVLFTAVIALLSPLLVMLGAHLAHNPLGHQVFYYKDLAWHLLFYGWGFMMVGLLLGLLIRNQVGSIAALLLLPGLVEQLLGLVLKTNSKYLPFSLLDKVIHTNAAHDVPRGVAQIGPAKAAALFMIYLVVGWLVAYVLFQKRDGN